MNELHLFAGAGGGILGGILLGHTCVCAVEIEPYCQKVLLQRQRDGILPRFPIWDDIKTFDGTPWNGLVDIVCGGFPCQDISCAGKGAGLSGERSGLWFEMARVIGEIRPSYVFVENSPMLTIRGLDRVLGALSEMGYNAKWGIVSAAHIGAPHLRKRIWIMGWHADSKINKIFDTTNMHGNASANHEQYRKSKFSQLRDADSQNGTRRNWWLSEPNVGRVAHGVAHGMDRLKAIGNGQVPAVAALAWEILSGKEFR